MPKKTRAHLRMELQAMSRPEGRIPFNEGLAALAEKLGDRKAARRMRIKTKVVALLAARDAAKDAEA